MPYSIDERSLDRPLPPELSPEAFAFPRPRRRDGVIAALRSAIRTLAASRRLDRRRRARARLIRDIPGWLREDLGLPPLPPPVRLWWDDL